MLSVSTHFLTEPIDNHFAAQREISFRTMESAASPNVDIEKFLYPTTKRRDVKWKCPDFVVSMLQDGTNADIKFTAFGGSVYAHECVLKYVCPYLHYKFLRKDIK